MGNPDWDGFLGVCVIVLVGGVYFLPVFIASHRQHNNTAAIFWTNLLLGWSVLGWIITFIWAWTDNVEGESGKKNAA